MAYGRLIEYEGLLGERVRRDVIYPAVARRAAQLQTANTPTAEQRRPLRAWLTRRLNRAAA